MERSTSPSVKVIYVSHAGLDSVDEFDDCEEDFDRTPRTDETCQVFPSPRSDTESVLNVECNQLLPLSARSRPQSVVVTDLCPRLSSRSRPKSAPVTEISLELTRRPRLGDDIQPELKDANHAEDGLETSSNPGGIRPGAAVDLEERPSPGSVSVSDDHNLDSVLNLSLTLRVLEVKESLSRCSSTRSSNQLVGAEKMPNSRSRSPMEDHQLLNDSLNSETGFAFPNERIQVVYSEQLDQPEQSAPISKCSTATTRKTSSVADSSEHGLSKSYTTLPPKENQFEELDISSQQKPHTLHQKKEDWFTPEVIKKICCAIALVIVLIGIMIGFLLSAIHIIHEGKVGIYFRNGALLDEHTFPGIHWKLPYVDRFEEINIVQSTETIPPVEVLTNDGVVATFDEIQVLVQVRPNSVVTLVKRFGKFYREILINDRLSEEVRIFCANRSVDEILTVKYFELVPTVRKSLDLRLKQLNVSQHIKVQHLTIPKPDVPEKINDRYENIHIQWIERLVEAQRQATQAINKETEMMKALMDAEIRKAVSEIQTEINLLKMEGNRNISTLNDVIVRKREQTVGEILKYKKTREAEANTYLLKNQAYVDLTMGRKMASEAKTYFSDKESMLGSIMKQIMDA